MAEVALTNGCSSNISDPAVKNRRSAVDVSLPDLNNEQRCRFNDIPHAPNHFHLSKERELEAIEQEATLLTPLVLNYLFQEGEQAEHNFRVISGVAYGLAFAKLYEQESDAAEFFLSLNSLSGQLSSFEQKKLLDATIELTRMHRVNLQSGVNTVTVDPYCVAAAKSGEEARDVIRLLQTVVNYGGDLYSAGLDLGKMLPSMSDNPVAKLLDLKRRHQQLTKEMLSSGKSIQCCAVLEDALYCVQQFDEQITLRGRELSKIFTGGHQTVSPYFWDYDGGLDEVDEFFSSRAIFSLSCVFSCSRYSRRSISRAINSNAPAKSFTCAYFSRISGLMPNS